MSHEINWKEFLFIFFLYINSRRSDKESDLFEFFRIIVRGIKVVNFSVAVDDSSSRRGREG